MNTGLNAAIPTERNATQDQKGLERMIFKDSVSDNWQGCDPRLGTADWGCNKV